MSVFDSSNYLARDGLENEGDNPLSESPMKPTEGIMFSSSGKEEFHSRTSLRHVDLEQLKEVPP